MAITAHDFDRERHAIPASMVVAKRAHNIMMGELVEPAHRPDYICMPPRTTIDKHILGSDSHSEHAGSPASEGQTCMSAWIEHELGLDDTGWGQDPLCDNEGVALLGDCQATRRKTVGPKNELGAPTSIPSGVRYVDTEDPKKPYYIDALPPSKYQPENEQRRRSLARRLTSSVSTSVCNFAGNVKRRMSSWPPWKDSGYHSDDASDEKQIEQPHDGGAENSQEQIGAIPQTMFTRPGFARYDSGPLERVHTMAALEDQDTGEDAPLLPTGDQTKFPIPSEPKPSTEPTETPTHLLPRLSANHPVMSEEEYAHVIAVAVNQACRNGEFARDRVDSQLRAADGNRTTQQDQDKAATILRIEAEDRRRREALAFRDAEKARKADRKADGKRKWPWDSWCKKSKLKQE